MIMCHNVFNVWPKTTLLLPVWHRDTKRLGTPGLETVYSVSSLGIGKEEIEGEEHQCVVASHTPPTGVLAYNTGMCPDWESNQQPFGSQASTQSIEPHQPGHAVLHFIIQQE